MDCSRGNFHQADEDPNQRSRRKKNVASGENSESGAAGQGAGEGKKALYHCNYCSKDITGKIFIKCAICPDFNLCIECFSVGAEVTPHKSYHPYRIMDKPSFLLICPDRNADDEILLLEDMSHVGGKNRKELLAMAKGQGEDKKGISVEDLSLKAESPFSPSREIISTHLPPDMSLLRLQDKHITKDIWEGKERLLRPRRHAIWAAKHSNMLDARVKILIEQAGFGQFLTLANIDINHHLITALVERWRSETHTFHFPIGEATVTLEDVSLQLGLPIDGEAVTGITSGDLTIYCESLLGLLPPKDVVKGNSIKLSWLNNSFQELPDNVSEIVITQHARAHILTIIGSLLMPDTSASRVHLMYLLLLENLNKVQQFSWGSAVLATLYRALDHGVTYQQENIGGCMILLQCWAWEHITCISPVIPNLTDEDITAGIGFPLIKRWSRPGQRLNSPQYVVQSLRYTFDVLQPNEFLWTPYRRGIIPQLINVDVSPICRAKVPIICFAIVEFHQADRVMRQFGLRQHIPPDPINLDQQHKQDMRGRSDIFWPLYQQEWITLWNNRHNHLIHGDNFNGSGHLRENTSYMQWYFQRIIRYISHHSPPRQQQHIDDEYDD